MRLGSKEKSLQGPGQRDLRWAVLVAWRPTPGTQKETQWHQEDLASVIWLMRFSQSKMRNGSFVADCINEISKGNW